jgi:hypothetical protein
MNENNIKKKKLQTDFGISKVIHKINAVGDVI